MISRRRAFWSFAILLGAVGLITPVTANAAAFTITDSGCCFIDMSPVQVSSPVTIANFDPATISFASLYAVQFTFTINNYTCSGCQSPSLETIGFAGNETLCNSATPGPTPCSGPTGTTYSILGSTCQMSITGNGTASTGICLVNSMDLADINSAFSSGANTLSVFFQGPGNAPIVNFCATNCSAMAIFYPTAADVGVPEPATIGLMATGIGLCLAFRRRRA